MDQRDGQNEIKIKHAGLLALSSKGRRAEGEKDQAVWRILWNNVYEG